MVEDKTVSQDDARAYYDAACAKRLRHYIYGNPRVDRAMEFVVSNVPMWASSLLDIGCGIGYSTYYLKTRFPRLRARGVDLSGHAIEIASKLFGGQGIEFVASDVTEYAAPDRYDVVTMIDVYEHVPRENRQALYLALSSALTNPGTLIMTVPSVMQQAYLRTHHPSAIQVVDEDVTIEDVSELASTLGGYVRLFEHVAVWRPADYVYAVIERGSSPLDHEQPTQQSPRSLQRGVRASVRRRLRATQVARHLGIQVTPGGEIVRL